MFGNIHSNVKGMTTDQMLNASVLNWKVQRRAIAMRPGDGDRSKMLTEPLSGFRAIVRSDTDEVFQVASERYQPVQNREVVDFFREFCDAGHAEMDRITVLKGGAVIVAQARLNGGTVDLIGPGDQTEGKLFISTSHDGSLITMAAPTHISIVCENTLAMAMSGARGRESTYTLRHTTKFDDAQKTRAKEIVGKSIEQVQQINSLASQLAKVTIDHDGWMEFMGKLMGEEGVIDKKTADLTRTAAAIQEATMTSPGSALPSRAGTLWGAVNGVTYYADHQARSRSESNRLFSAWFGLNRNLKTSALVTAAEIAGIKV